jgi:hypothetical protein
MEISWRGVLRESDSTQFRVPEIIKIHECRNKTDFLEFSIIVSGEFFPNKDVLGLVKFHCSTGRLISVRTKEG